MNVPTPEGRGGGGWGGGSTSRSSLFAPRPTLASAPRVGPLDAHLEGQGQLPWGVKQGPHYLQEPSGISDRRLGEWPHLPLTLLPRLSHIGHLGPFCPQATLAAFHPPPARLPLAPSPGTPTVQRMSTVLSPDCQCFLLPITVSPAIIRILCSLFLPSVFPLVCLCASLLSLTVPL